MMDKILKIVKVVVFLILLVVLLKILSSVFVPKTSEAVTTVKSFYTEPKDSLDVIFLGDSAVYSGISPIVLWDEYKIASYNYATPAERIWTTYYTIQEAIKYQKPKLIVIDTGCIYENHAQAESHLRNNLDSKKNSITKLKAVTNPIYKHSLFDVASYFIPVLRYHDRWDKLSHKDFNILKDYHSATKGYNMSAKIKGYKKDFDYFKTTSQKENMNVTNKEYLEKIISICNSHNISILFISVPDAKTWNYAKHNAFVEYSRDVNIPYIDFNEYAEEIGFDWKHDTSDSGTHLNMYGAEKITSYLGKYLINNYTFENHDGDERYIHWEKDSLNYKKLKEKKIENIKNKNKVKYKS